MPIEFIMGKESIGIGEWRSIYQYFPPPYNYAIWYENVFSNLRYLKHHKPWSKYETIKY